MAMVLDTGAVSCGSKNAGSCFECDIFKEFVERKERLEEFTVVFYKDIFNEEELRKRGLKERQIKAVMYVKRNGKITIREYKELYPLLSDKTLSRDLAELVKKGVLKEIGNKKGRKYEL